MAYVKYKIGTVVKNNQGSSFEILGISKDKRYDLKSLETGYEVNVSRSALYSGRFLDKLQLSKLGICRIGNPSKFHKSENLLWHSMIDRCYNKKHSSYKYYGARGVTVCDRWLRFDYFLQDLRNMKGYDLQKLITGEIELDKDILQYEVETHEKIYSPETCIMIPKNVNLVNTTRNKNFYALSPKNILYSHTVVKFFAKEHKLDDSCIIKCLKGKRKSHKGYCFSYDKNVLEQQKIANDYRNHALSGRK